MPRFKLTIEYDGTRYAGWQLQKNERTVQGAFFDALKKIFPNKKFEFYGAGRTDAGVHATGQVAHLDVKTDHTPQRLLFALNDNLPFDVNVLEVEMADPDFHARYDTTSRSYVYVISHKRTAFCKGNVWWVRDRLDLARMREVARIMVGFKDYASFTDKKGETESTQVDVVRVDVLPVGNITCINVVGSHFLWKMVRRMVGVIVEAGRGRLAPAEIEAMFRTRSDLPARLTAPPSGLYLSAVCYDDEEPPRGQCVVPRLMI